MRKSPFLPIAALGLCCKPFLLGALASDLGLTDAGGFLSAVMRYLIVPEGVCAACLFFLWMDPVRYAQFRPLAIVLQAVSLAMALLALPAVGDLAEVLFEPRELAVAALRGAGVIVLDTAGLVAALLASPTRSPAPQASEET